MTPAESSVLHRAQRIVVVGSGGAGKTTFAGALGDRLGLPVVHLDRLFWHPGWTPTPPDEWRRIQEEIVSRERWVIDGNYSRTLDIRFSAADVIVFLDLGRYRCLARVVKRSLRNHGRDTQAAGCPERLDPAFLRWVWRYPNDSRRRVVAAMQEHGAHVPVVAATSPRQVRRLLAGAERR